MGGDTKCLVANHCKTQIMGGDTKCLVANHSKTQIMGGDTKMPCGQSLQDSNYGRRYKNALWPITLRLKLWEEIQKCLVVNHSRTQIMGGDTKMPCGQSL